ncbi:MAG: NAD(P)/FAD-dependent oxidoreductase [Limnospira sp. PMC 1291.21]|uniref:demethylphylloquinone reductase n=2 Tax=Limnospira TaxID=2596745 RepID=B5W965_LIMMA|nr:MULTISPECIES: NAD(P)/FAD-dependent oxidoreductase [Limnospira]MDC0839311.1 NAD(P)/FAD-dependent oxidoreductase [Limnoraphis robusta]MDY7051572.1 NAD(P)/FAD-dependent oxidoreductase [Limnospira fusiformis LS22]QJB26311.1 NAD(P)/FAD-dependent oxidoreductase [Limnospira fusiformis SAG 85.79]UWU48377.1 NADH dehydrogenase [Arthrospira platensis C1]EDZ91937.1 FAD-dependent pyridine nucleotide-disulphide oxidoreductase [Limnospira maxima CS-328]
MTEQPTRICILGGGFGGLYTALRLTQLPWLPTQTPEITIVDSRDRFVFAPLLYELVTGELQAWEIAPPFEQLLEETPIRFIQGTVADIDITARQVQLQDGQFLDYDRLVLAMGGETPLDIVPGSQQYAIPFRRVEDAYRLQERLRILEASDAEKIRVAIIGGGYSGVELACKLAERLGKRGRLRLVERGEKILKSAPDFNREAAQKALSERQVWLDLETTVQSLDAESITLEYRDQVDTLPVDIVMWTVGTQTPDLVRSLPLKQNTEHQIIINPQLQVIEHPEIFALGDLADCHDAEGKKVPKTAQAAFQQADYAGWNLWASLTGRPLLSFHYQALGEMMTLGKDNATLTGLGIKLDGQLAHVARRLIYLYRLPTLEHQMRVAFNWISRPIQELMINK